MFESVKEMIIKLEREKDEEEMHLWNSKIKNWNKRFQIVVEAILESRSMIHDERTTVHVTLT